MQVSGYDAPKPKAKPRVEQNRVLVTGGAGFVGSHLCTFLVERGDQVRNDPAAMYMIALHWGHPEIVLRECRCLWHLIGRGQAVSDGRFIGGV